MCRGFTGSNHRDYSPSRSATLSYWRRLPTIYEATDVEMADAESDTNKRGTIARKEMETAHLLREFSPLNMKTSKKPKTVKERNVRCEVSLGKHGLIEAGASQFRQQVQDEWSYFLKTPYAEFFPENASASIMDSCFSLSRARKKQIAANNTELQAHQFSEIAAWLEFFG